MDDEIMKLELRANPIRGGFNEGLWDLSFHLSCRANRLAYECSEKDYTKALYQAQQIIELAKLILQRTGEAPPKKD